MLASYLLSRTLVPTMMVYLLGSELHMYREGTEGEPVRGRGILRSVHHQFNALFEGLRFATSAYSNGRCGIAVRCLRHSP